jgi:hypothetical protein
MFKYYYNNSIAFNRILNKKKSFWGFTWQISFLLVLIFQETFFVVKYGRAKGYTMLQIFKEIAIVISLRFSALLGDIFGNK